MTKKVVILGAGIVGAAIAYELSLCPEFDVTILDTTPPATGSTGAALGVLMGIISRKTKGRAWQLRRRSMTRFPELLQELAAAGHPVPYNPDGILKLFDDSTDLEKLEKLQQKRKDSGWQLDIWDAPQIQIHCPQITPDIGAGAVYSPQDFQVQPVPLTEALLNVAQNNGVQCHFEISPPQLHFTEQFCTSIQTDIHAETLRGSPLAPLGKGGTNQKQKKNFECDWLIVAAGLGSLEITKPLLAELHMKPVLGQAFHVKTKSAGQQAQAFTPVVSYEDIHVIPLGDGEFWVGATLEFADDAGKVVADEKLMTEVWQRAIAFYPELKDAEILRHWSGDRPRPEGQGAPVLQPLQGYKNILLATGHYRNGVLLAPATALKIRDWLLAPETIPV